MRGSILVRPNLKLFFFGAILLLAVQDLVTRGQSQTTVVHARSRPVPDATLRQWLAQATESNAPEICMRLSHEYYRRGEIKRALFFLRRAEQLAELEP